MGKTKMKATYHCGRTTKAGKVFNANHNTRTETRNGQSHINHEQTQSNLLYRVEHNKLIRCTSYDGIAFEKKRYDELFSDSLEAKNERYRQQRHAERCRTMEDVYRDPKKCPFEMILQIGKASDEMTAEKKAELSQKVNIDFVRVMYRRYGKNFIPLDLSGHYDEASIHWHYRAVFVYQGKDGLEPNQSKALQEMEIERPDLTKPVGKRNNALMTFTKEVRELYYEICERYGLEIDREVKNPSQKHKETLEHKCEVLEKEVVAKDQAIADMTARLEAIIQEKSARQVEADREADRYKQNKMQADKEEIRAINNSELAEKLLTHKVKHNKDGTVTVGLKQYQEATAIIQATKTVLDSEVYTPSERKEMQRATEILQAEKKRYEVATQNIEERIERRAEEKSHLQERSEQHRISQLEQALAQERNDKNYILEKMKQFFTQTILERFMAFSGIALYERQHERGRTR